MSKVKVINIEQFVQTLTKGKYTSYQEHSVAVIEGPKGVVITDKDAIHTLEDSLDESILIHVVLDDGEMKLMPEGRGDETINNLLAKAPVTEQPLAEYVRTFGNRIEENYKLLMYSIEEIGLNPDDFKRKV